MLYLHYLVTLMRLQIYAQTDQPRAEMMYFRTMPGQSESISLILSNARRQVMSLCLRTDICCEQRPMGCARSLLWVRLCYWNGPWQRQHVTARR